MGLSVNLHLHNKFILVKSPQAGPHLQCSSRKCNPRSGGSAGAERGNWLLDLGCLIGLGCFAETLDKGSWESQLKSRMQNMALVRGQQTRQTLLLGKQSVSSPRRGSSIDYKSWLHADWKQVFTVDQVFRFVMFQRVQATSGALPCFHSSENEWNVCLQAPLFSKSPQWGFIIISSSSVWFTHWLCQEMVMFCAPIRN